MLETAIRGGLGLFLEEEDLLVDLEEGFLRVSLPFRLFSFLAGGGDGAAESSSLPLLLEAKLLPSSWSSDRRREANQTKERKAIGVKVVWLFKL